MRVTVDRRRSPHWRLFDVIFSAFHFHSSLKACWCHLFYFSLSLFTERFLKSSFLFFTFWLFLYSYHLLDFSQCDNAYILMSFCQPVSLKTFYFSMQQRLIQYFCLLERFQERPFIFMFPSTDIFTNIVTNLYSSQFVRRCFLCYLSKLSPAILSLPSHHGPFHLTALWVFFSLFFSLFSQLSFETLTLPFFCSSPLIMAHFTRL